MEGSETGCLIGQSGTWPLNLQLAASLYLARVKCVTQLYASTK